MEADAAGGKFERAPTQAESLSLTVLGRELVDIDARLKKYAEVARELKERRMELQMRLMVDAMDAIGMDRMGLPDQDVDLEMSDYFKASLPSPDDEDTPEEAAEKLRLRAEGIAWLTEHHPDLLSTTLVLQMPKGSLDTAMAIRAMIEAPAGGVAIVLPEGREELAREIAAMLVSEQGYGLREDQVRISGATGFGIEPGRARIDEGVHWATLTSFVKEQTRAKQILPLASLGATVGRIVKIVKRKKSK